MARLVSTDLRLLLQRLRGDLRPSLNSSVNELICELQERHVPEARRVAVQLARDLLLCHRFQAQYCIFRVIALLSEENVFDQCDELSAWLLFLEQEVESTDKIAQADGIDRVLDKRSLKTDIANSELGPDGDPVLYALTNRVGKGVV